MAQNLWKWDSDSESEGNDAMPNEKSSSQSKIKTSAHLQSAMSFPMSTGRFHVVALPSSNMEDRKPANKSLSQHAEAATSQLQPKMANAHAKSIEKVQAKVEKLGVGDAENETSATTVSDSVEGRASPRKRVSRLPPPPSNLMDDSEEELIFEFDKVE